MTLFSNSQIASCAFVPWSGSLAQIFGRRPLLLSSLGFFFVGSALCGASKEISVMLLGRTAQGIGAGGILTLSEIVRRTLEYLRAGASFSR